MGKDIPCNLVCPQTSLSVALKVCREQKTFFRVSVLLLGPVVKLILQVAYLASSLFLDSNSNLIVLVVNTMLQDLRSENYLIGTLLASVASFHDPATQEPARTVTLARKSGSVPFSSGQNA